MSPDRPLLVRFFSKLVLDILPAALASVIGGLLFSHYAGAKSAPGRRWPYGPLRLRRK